MSSLPTNQRPPPSNHASHDASDQSAALKGASLAFSKQKTTSTTGNGPAGQGTNGPRVALNNGALLAATSES